MPGLLGRGSPQDRFGLAARSTFGPARFLVTALLLELLFFALLSYAWVERHALGPLAKVQVTLTPTR